jgi:hypothetical protein
MTSEGERKAKGAIGTSAACSCEDYSLEFSLVPNGKKKKAL